MIRLFFDNQLGAGDLARDGGNLELDEGLETAIVLSLFEDARADGADAAARPEDLRGWWANTFAETPLDVRGSSLWLLAREKRTEETRARAQRCAQDALDWLIQDKVAVAVNIAASWLDNGRLKLEAEIDRGPDAGKWTRAWEVQLGV
jgi:phage gp46-like protein